MRKVIFLILGMMLPTTFTAATPSPDRLAEAKKQFPYSLIGDDFGILSREDLAINTCDVFPQPFSLDSNYVPYWQCFSAKGVHIDCSGGGYDADEHTHLTIMAVVANKDAESHEYLSRRAVSLKTCKSYQKDWVRLSKNQDYVCISGSLIRRKPAVNGDVSGWAYSWIFESFKTRLGCSSYFEGGCSLTYQINHNHCKVVQAQNP
ncbi:MAG: hypothetical protein AABZ06_03805 [Bdellovibrionota bacterium]